MALLSYWSRRTFLACLLITVFAAPLVASVVQEREKLAKGFALGIKKRTIWQNLYNPRQRDQLYEPVNPLAVLPYKDQGVTVFFSRAGELVHGLDDMLNMAVGEDMIREFLEVKFALETTVPDPYDKVEDEIYAEDSDDFNADLATYNASVQGRADQISADVRKCANMMTFQEHRLGIGLSKEWRYGQWYAAARTWAGMAERNYWLDEENRETIAGLMQDVFPDLDGKFNQKDFIAMRWGLGDTHLKVGYVLPILSNLDLSVGVRSVLPTGRGVGRTSKNKIIPIVANEFKDFARIRLNEVLIDPQLGNNGHYGIGAWADLTWNRLKPRDRYKLSVQLYGGLDYLFEAGEERLLLRREQLIVDGGGNELKNFALKNHFESNDIDFRSYINQYVIPTPATVIVAPGIIAQGGAVAQYRFDKAAVFFGYDVYYKEKEEFMRFKKSTHAERYIPQQEILRQSKEQHKLMGGMSYNISGKNVNLLIHTFDFINLSISLHGAASVSSKGLGDDFVLALSAGSRF